MLTNQTIENLCQIDKLLQRVLELSKTLPNYEHLGVICILTGHLMSFVEQQTHLAATKLMYDNGGYD